MTLLTKEIQVNLPALYSQEHNPDPLVVVRFFDSLGNWSWYAAEFDGTDLFFGLVHGFESELGYFTLSEFEEVNRSAGFERIQRDAHFKPKPLSEIKKESQ